MKAITFLGLRPTDTNYIFPDGRAHTAPFFGAALARIIPDLNMRVFVTEAAYRDHYDNFQRLVEDLVADVQPVPITDGRNDAELWQIFQAVVDAVEPEERVVFDITHGFRSLPFLAFLSAAYLRAVKHVRLEAVYYGNFDARDKSVEPGQLGRTPVINLTRFVDLLDWMVAADRLTRFGDAHDLADLLGAQHEQFKPDHRTASKAEMAAWSRSPVKTTISNLKRVSRALRVVRPSEAMDASHAVQSQLPDAMQSIEALARPFAPLSQHVVDSFTSIALAANDQQNNPLEALAFERALIGWYLQRNQVFQAVALAREWLLSWVMAQVGLTTQMTDKDARLQVEGALGRELQNQRSKAQVRESANTLPDLSAVASLSDIVNLYGQLGDLRNDLMHAGKRKRAYTADEVERKARELCRMLDDLAVV